MSSVLRLYLSSDWPTATTACEWALYDARGSLLQRGSSEPRHWPAATNVDVVLSPDQSLSLLVALPVGASRARSASADLIAYAVEERLAGDIENEHFVAGATRPDGQTPVWIVGRARLRGVLAALEQLQRKPGRVFSELQLAPLGARRWSACLRERSGFVRSGSESGFAFDWDLAQPEPPAALHLAIQAARKANDAPEAIDVFCAESAAMDPAAWHAALGVPVRRAGDYIWQSLPPRNVRNLLTGEFAPQGERGAAWAAFKPAVVLGVVTLISYSVFSVGRWVWLDREAGRLNAQKMELFRATFPRVQTIVDPSLQMRRLYDQARRERGQLGESDFLPLLDTVSDALDKRGTLRSLSYEEGRLELAVALPGALAAQRLSEAFAQRGLSSTLRGSRVAGAGIEASFSVRRGR